ncbi:uncharacterized protein LOC128270669 [Anopheles cruzii]|uniref:uncharacterized protein LOC128270669 n=1 Tax=Anopheles cruzii TaxID=68878 RepID=UPI0022EC7A74|nr:uncharacterized protein LOC128270669 [Anopheles cruzii]
MPFMMHFGHRGEGKWSKRFFTKEESVNNLLGRPYFVYCIHVVVEKIEKKPIILNKLAKPVIASVEEDFVTTGDGIVQMVIKNDSVPETVGGTLKVEVIETGPLQTKASPGQAETRSINHQQEQGERGVFPCTECDRSFPLKQLLDIHMLNHTRARNFPCELCDKRFFSKYDLAKHHTTHTGERPYVCVVCRAAFSRSTLLTRHQTTHKDLLQHTCTYCNRDFITEADLSGRISDTKSTGTDGASRFVTNDKLEAHHQAMHLDELADELTEEQREQLMSEEQERGADEEKAQFKVKRSRGRDPARLEMIFEPDELDESEVILGGDELLVEESDVAGFDDTNGVYLYDEHGHLFRDPPETIEDGTIEVTELELTSKMEENEPTEETPERTTLPENKIKVDRQSSFDLCQLIKHRRTTSEKSKSVSDVLKNLPKGVTIKSSLSTVTQKSEVAHASTNPESSKVREWNVLTSVPKSKAIVSEKPMPVAQVEKKIVVRGPVKVDKPSPEIAKANPAAVVGKVNPVAVVRKDKSEANTSKGNTSGGNVKVESVKLDKSPPKRSASSGVLHYGKPHAVKPSVEKPPGKSVSSLKRPEGLATKVERKYSVAAKQPATPKAAELQEQPGPSKRLLVQRKTLDPAATAAPSTMTRNAQQLANVTRAVKRLATPTPASTVGNPVEMSVGGKKIKMQKLVFSKANTVALAREGKLKDKP